jgi:hypothetical protein
MYRVTTYRNVRSSVIFADMDADTITTAEACEIIGRSSRTLMRWQQQGWGPQSVLKANRRFYSRRECEIFAERLRNLKPCCEPLGRAPQADEYHH